MTPEDRDRMMARLLATWPTPKMPDPTFLVWTEHLTPLDVEQAARALRSLERSSDRRPSIAKFHEAFAAARDPNERRLPAPSCGMCEDGWVDLTPALTGTAHTMKRCPNGCMPKTAVERAAMLEVERDDWFTARQAERERLGQVHDPAEPRDREEVF